MKMVMWLALCRVLGGTACHRTQSLNGPTALHVPSRQGPCPILAILPPALNTVSDASRTLIKAG